MLVGLRFIFLLLIVGALQATPLPPKNFQEAKQAARALWQPHRYTFYCGCPYDKQGRIRYQSCDFIPKDNLKSKRISWEHVVPVSWYGRRLSCWQQPLCADLKGKHYRGRQCCQKRSKAFRKMEADLHNLVPTIPDLNRARKNYVMTEIENDLKLDNTRYQGCQLWIDDARQLFEPPNHTKGMVARIHLYITEKYRIPLTKQDKIRYQRWNEQYPPTMWEKKRNQWIKERQGDSNPYVEIVLR